MKKNPLGTTCLTCTTHPPDFRRSQPSTWRLTSRPTSSPNLQSKWHSTSRATAVAGLVGLAALAAAGPGAAADWPAKAVRIVVPSSPGGSADAIARQVGDRLGRALGQPVVIENKGGGGGNIATEAVARAPADGYSVLLTGNNHTINVALFGKPPYRLEDFRPVIELTRGPSVFVTAPGSSIASLADLIAKARAEPNTISFGSPGIGLPSHIAVELFTRAAGIDLVHVPYKGSGPSLTDAIGGQIPVVSSTLAAAMPHLTSGKLRALAVTSAQRWPSLPDVPTVAEAGLPGYAHLTWLGLLVPRGTPDAVVARLNAQVGTILAEPQMAASLEKQGASPVGGSSDAFGAMIASDAEASKRLVQDAGLRLE